MPDRVYLDWNATAPLRPEAREAMSLGLAAAKQGLWEVAVRHFAEADRLTWHLESPPYPTSAEPSGENDRVI